MRLINIDFIRPLIILLIVVNHVFAIYAGVWESPWENADNIEIYKWVQRVAICCSLQLFTFISGYIYAFQVKRAGVQSLKLLISKKTHRLLIPYVFFGTLYYVLIGSGDNYSVDGFVQQLLHGKSHLWFLLMLFWCFIIHWIIISLTPQKCSKKMYLVILLPLFLYFVSPVVTDFLCLKQAFMYYVFFYVGFLSYDMFKPNIRVTLALTTSYVFLFVIFYYYVDHRSTIGMYPLYKIIELSTKLGGVFCFMSLANTFTQTRNRLSKQYLYLVSMSFGIYIYHQFVIQFIYYKTDIPEILGVYWTPIVCLIITLFSSILLTVVSKKLPVVNKMI